MGVISRVIDWLVDGFSALVSSRIQFLSTIALTLLYIFINTRLSKPFDDIAGGLPKLVLFYTLWFAWVEQIVKVAQRKQQTQDDRTMEQLIKLVRDGESRDLILQQLLNNQAMLVTKIVDTLEIQDGFKILDNLELYKHQFDSLKSGLNPVPDIEPLGTTSAVKKQD
jgi:hypothetical protein